ncbi:MAG: GTP-binding ypt4 [Lasallia pustulata]|uniref:GTP-binding ypt4 n=1 Tax=Lasallia pustulata TaxID=136370 RepID=A0A5M8Q245_9LECA|nr:MAG: GTP-binding ypt4 [Lasallia pustulata]
MARQRRASDASSGPDTDQELGSMYDYLAKIILLGPSGTGKTCLLHRLLNHEWRSLTSQTIGVEFSTHLIPIGRTRIKLQLWDTAGTERFRSVSRSYYRGAAGALLVYDVANRASFDALPHFWRDARALASRHLVGVLVGNKADLAAGPTRRWMGRGARAWRAVRGAEDQPGRARRGRNARRRAAGSGRR